MVVEPTTTPCNEMDLRKYHRLLGSLVGAIKTEDKELLKEIIPTAKRDYQSQLHDLIVWGEWILNFEKEASAKKLRVLPKHALPEPS